MRGLCEVGLKARWAQQKAGSDKSIKANLPRVCNSFSIGDRASEEGGTVDMTHV